MLKLQIPDMSCGHCKRAIEEAIQALDSDASLTFDMEKRQLSISSTLPQEQLLSMLSEVDYPASVIES